MYQGSLQRGFMPVLVGKVAPGSVAILGAKVIGSRN